MVLPAAFRVFPMAVLFDMRRVPSASRAVGRVAALAALLVAFLCGPAYAISIHDIIALHHAKVSDDILVALLDADPTLFSLDAAQILELKKAGVSDRVVVAMLHSGRQPRGSEQNAPSAPPETAPPPASLTPEAAPTSPVQAPTPGYVVVGQSPEVPSAAPPLVFVAPTPWVATFVGVPSRARVPAATPYHGFGRFINDGFTGSQPGRFVNDGFVDPATSSAAPVVTFSTPPVAGVPQAPHGAGHHRR